MKKERAALNYWAKSITPSPSMRQEYHRHEINYKTFTEKYRNELDTNPDFQSFVEMIRKNLEMENVTLVYASKTPEISHIPILKNILRSL